MNTWVIVDKTKVLIAAGQHLPDGKGVICDTMTPHEAEKFAHLILAAAKRARGGYKPVKWP